MEKYVKFLRRLPKPLRQRLISVVDRIARNDIRHLDIKPLAGKGDFYRCRVGKVRIIFQKENGKDQNIIYDIGFRGDIYT